MGSYSGYGPPITMDITPLINMLATRIGIRLGWQDRENGQALIEYSLIMVLVV